MAVHEKNAPISISRAGIRTHQYQVRWPSYSHSFGLKLVGEQNSGSCLVPHKPLGENYVKSIDEIAENPYLER